MKKLTRENQASIIGTLEKVDIDKKTNKDGKPYISGNLVIKVFSPKEESIPVTFYCAPLTKENKPRKLYSQLEALRLGQRVNITAQIGANMFWDTTRGQLVKGKRLSVVFINDVRSTDVDKAEFVFSGFVKEPLKEVTNVDQEVTGYAIKLAQASYDGVRAETIQFNVDPQDTKAINFILREYTKGRTVKVTGKLDYDVKVETRVERQDFGPDRTTTFQRNIANLIIVSGQSVDTEVYETEDVQALLEGEIAEENRIEREAKTAEQSGAMASTNKPMASNSGANQSLL